MSFLNVGARLAATAAARSPHGTKRDGNGNPVYPGFHQSLRKSGLGDFPMLVVSKTTE